MRWFWQSSSASDSHSQAPSQPSAATHELARTAPSTQGEDALPLQDYILKTFTEPQTLISTVLLTSTLLFSIRLYKRHLRRIPTTFYLKASNFPAPTSNSTHATSTLRPGPSLFGTVTSINDPDNFRFYHTPGGRFLLWSSFLRPIPHTRQALKDQTLHIRIAGIDAPEMGHFGKQAQPYSNESLRFLKGQLEGRRVRIYPLRRDQYERVVALVFVSRGWLRGWRENWWEEWPYLWRKDVGLEVIRAGMATVYEAKTGVEFGGEEREKKYRQAENLAKGKRRGLWGGLGNIDDEEPGVLTRIAVWFGWKRKPAAQPFETPREYKTRMAKTNKAQADEEKDRKLKS